jgi:hypothetical protein
MNDFVESEPRRDAGSPAGKDGKFRTVLDAEHREWRVRELRAPSFDRERGTDLIFDAVGIARRVREFPSNWMTLSDDDLLRLSTETEVARLVEREPMPRSDSRD